jgi:hypothetical protein
MPVTLIKTAWNAGNLDFQDSSGSIIATFDSANRKLNLPSGSTLESTSFIQSSGIMYVGDTANGNMTLGLTINQGAADDHIISLKSSDVAHGITDLLETDTYGLLKKDTGASGGLMIVGANDAGTGKAVQIQGYNTDAGDTTKSTAGLGIVNIEAYIKTSATVTLPGSNQNLLTVRAGSTTRFILDTEGSGHADVEWVAFDAHDDVAVMDGFQAVLSSGRLTPERYGDNSLVQNWTSYEEMGIVGKDSLHEEDGKVRCMVNFTRLQMLHHGAILQVADRVSHLEGETKALQGQITHLLRA